jgi:hypothetical protein
MSDVPFEEILVAMKEGAAALREADVPFALAGGLAVYAHGGPPTEHDVDFLLRVEDCERALEALDAAGFRSETPPEGWLYKVFSKSGAMIDLIHSPNSKPEVVPAMLDRAEPIEVYAITLPVMSVTDVLATKLLTLKEHELDYDGVVEVARTCREQVDWEQLRGQTADSPYAQAFFTLVEGLQLT